MSRTDGVIVVLALGLVIGLFALVWTPGGRADSVSVWVAGEQRHSLPLSQDRRIEVSGPLGESIIEIRDRRVRVIESPGPRKICVRVGWMEAAGESAVCLPNQVVVRLEGGERRFDSMNF